MERVVSIICFGFTLFILFWYRPAKERQFALYKTATKISKYFGDTDIALFRFKDIGFHGETRIICVLLDYKKWQEYPLTASKKHTLLQIMRKPEKSERKKRKRCSGLFIFFHITFSAIMQIYHFLIMRKK